ncbi:MAG TPA: amino acid adenylation domain-containing protein, partial [Polyangiaceae bacterium]
AGEVVQIIAPPETPALLIFDLSRCSPEEQRAKLQSESERPFQLETDAPFRIGLYRTGSASAYLLVTVHHIVFDGYSSLLLVNELLGEYTRLAGSATGTLARPRKLASASYDTFIQEERRYLASSEGQAALNAWKAQLSGHRGVLELPIDLPRPARQTFQGALQNFVVSPELSLRLREAARQHSVSLSAVLQSVLCVLLLRYSGEADLIVGVPTLGRTESRFAETIGYFINMLPLRTKVDPEASFWLLCQTVQRSLLEALDRQRVPFPTIVEASGVARDAGRSPLFQVCFQHANWYRGIDRQLAPEVLALGIKPVFLEQQRGQFDLKLEVLEQEAQLDCCFSYRSDLFLPSMVAQLAAHYQSLLNAAVRATEHETPASLPLLSKAERNRLLVEWNATERPIDDNHTLHELFERRVRRQPDAIAVVCGGDRLTYAELDQRANRVAHLLRELGVAPAQKVGIFLKRPVQLIEGLLGVLKAGACYVPLDVDHPATRRNYMAQTLDVRVLLTNEECLEKAAQTAGLSALLSLDGAGACGLPHVRTAGALDLARQSPGKPEEFADADALAYVIFTSGTTGTPKGVAVRHRPVVNLIDWVNRSMRVAATDRLLFVTSLSFDLSVYDVFGSLAAGASVELCSPEQIREPKELAARIDSGEISFWDSAPSLLLQVEPFLKGAPNNALRVVFLSGDWIPLSLARSLRAKYPQAELIALGGATEATVWSNFHRVREIAPTWVSIPYGRPIQNAKYYILDSRLEPVPVGVAGDLYIGGACLADGYANDPEQTRRKFVRDPFSDQPAARMYNTGDRARFWIDGTIEFLGRLDEQVKLRGFRIELGELESVLARHPEVQSAAAALIRGEGIADAELLAYAVPRSGSQPSSTQLLEHLAASLASYMLPTEVVILNELPLTTNGKLDRKALAKLPRTARSAAAGEMRNDSERRLAAIWKDRLRLQSVGPEESFFQCGGNSISAVALLQTINEEFGCEAPLRLIFERPTIRKLADWLDARIGGDEQLVRGAAPKADATTETGGADEPFELTELQQAYWLGQDAAFELAEIRPHLYLEYDTTSFDRERFERAWAATISRHPMLRAVVLADGRQRVLPEVDLPPIAWDDLSALDPAQGEARLAERREVMRQRGPSPAQWPPFEIRVSRLGSRDRLHFGISLLICDGMSLGILFRDWFAFYDHERPRLPDLGLTFREYCQHAATTKQTKAYQQARDYWLARIPSLPGPPALPILPIGNAGVRSLTRHERTIAPDAWARLTSLAAEWEITRSTLLCTLYSMVLSTWSGNSRFTLVLMYFNRRGFHDSVPNIVGNFSTTTLLETQLARSLSLRENARALQARLAEDLDASAFSGVELVRELRRHADARNATFPVTFASGLDLFDERQVTGGREGRTTYSALQVPQVWIDHQVYQSASGALELRFDVADELFPPGLVADLLDAYSALLLRVAEDRSARPLDEWLLPPREHLALQDASNETNAPVSEHELDQLLASAAQRGPDRPALISPARALRARELWDLVEQTAAQLQSHGVGRGALVPVVARKGWQQIAATLAIVRAGAAYVPIGPDLPKLRFERLLAELGAKVVLTEPSLVEQLAWPSGTVLITPGGRETSTEPCTVVAREPSDPAYVIYTSGSTGSPKGVVLDHRGPLNTILDINRRFEVDANDRVLAVSALTFDLSVYDIFGPMAVGGALVMPAAEHELDPRHWEALMIEHRVSIWNSAPQLLRLLLDYLDGRAS